DVARLQGLPAPTRDMPMQHVPAGVALRFAAIMGCRLQTVAEWKRAWEAEGSGGAVVWNRRDRTWAEFAGRKLPGAPGGNDGVFRPRGSANQDVQLLAEDQVYTDSVDGVAFFAPVHDGPGRVFKHLVGNVAEWAIGDGADIDAALQRDEPILAVEQVRRESISLNVIGGSALSISRADAD